MVETKGRLLMPKDLTYIFGFKGTHNASCRLVQALPGKRYFLTNSFSGLKKDMDVLDSSCGCVYVAMVKQVVESEAINDEDVE